MNLSKYIGQEFLFGINRLYLDRSDKLIVITGSVFVVLAALLKVAAMYAPSPVDAKYRAKFYTIFLTFGLAEIIWFGLRLQYVRFFGTHFVAMAMGLIALIWFLVTLVKMLKNYKAEKEAWQKAELRAKYLP